jgi:hypothetical protein
MRNHAIVVVGVVGGVSVAAYFIHSIISTMVSAMQYVLVAVASLALAIYFIVPQIWQWFIDRMNAALGGLFAFLCRCFLAPLSGLGRLVGYLGNMVGNLLTIPLTALSGVASICTGILGSLGMGSTVASGLFGVLGVGASWCWSSFGKWGSGLWCRSRKPAHTKKNGPASPQPSEDLSQPSEDLSQPSEDLSQAIEDTPQLFKDLSQPSEDLSQAIEDISQPSEDSTKVVATAQVSKYIREGALNTQTDMAKKAAKNAAVTAFRAVADAKVAADDALYTRTVISVLQFIQRVTISAIISNKTDVVDCKRFEEARKQCEGLNNEENTIQLLQNSIDLRNTLNTLRKASCVMEHALQAHNEYIATEKAKCQAKCANAKRWESQSKAADTNAPVMVNEVKNWTEGTSAEEPELDSSAIALRDQFMNGDCNSDFVTEMLSRMTLQEQQNCKMAETLTNQHFRKWWLKQQRSKEYGLFPSDAIEPIGSDQAGEGVGV